MKDKSGVALALSVLPVLVGLFYSPALLLALWLMLMAVLFEVETPTPKKK